MLLVWEDFLGLWQANHKDGGFSGVTLDLLGSCFSTLLCRWRWQFMASHPWVIIGLFKVNYDKLRTKD